MSAAGLPRDARVRRPQDFKRVFSRGRRLVQSPLALAYAASDSGTARIGLAIGKKYAASAVARNRVKRMTRESFRLRRSRLPVMDIVVYPVAKLSDRKRTQLSRSLEQLWNRLENISARS